MPNTICILWDIENVTPPKNSLLLDGLLDFARTKGKVSTSIAIGNWMERSISHMAQSLSEKGFELFHMPQSDDKEKRKKNSSDFMIIAKATEMIFQYPHIDTYILLSGDIDYRPLLQTLKKHGKQIIVICDSTTASENLLEFADEYSDFRDLMHDDESETSVQEPHDILSQEDAYTLLREAVELMVKKNKIPTPGSVKVRMQLLNDGFTGAIENYTSWKSFIKDAAKDNIIKIDVSPKGMTLALKDSKNQSRLPSLIMSLLDTLEELSKNDEWVLFTQINQNMIKNDIELKKPYLKFKTLVLDAEKRNLLETKNEGLTWYARKKRI